MLNIHQPIAGLERLSYKRCSLLQVTDWRDGEGSNLPTLVSCIKTVKFLIMYAHSHSIGKHTPDRPTSVVPATRHTLRIALIKISTSTVKTNLIFNETKNMIAAEKTETWL